jgi:benzylsuccinate CoA-transferase BbsF subunit
VSPSVGRQSAAPLTGIRVLDLTRQLAGAGGTRILAALGAEVIRVEWKEYPALDFVRYAPPFADGEAGVNRSGYFNNINANKLGVTLNMADPRGRELFIELLKKSDVVAENFSPKVMRDWRLDYESLKAVRGDIVYLAQAGFGHSGPYESYRTFGPTAEAFCGLTVMCGLPDREPAGWGYSYLDHMAGYHAALAVCSALIHRRRTGRGQFIDLAQTQLGCTLTGPAFVDWSVNRRPYHRAGNPPGNRSPHPQCVPHNAYRCRGEDVWCLIAVTSDDQWLALRKVMGEPEWASAAQFATLAGRLEHQDALDGEIEKWTVQRDGREVMHELQAAGVPAGLVQTAEDRVEDDPQLRTRGVFLPLEHSEVGPRLSEGLPFKLSKTPWSLTRGAPCLGEHNDDVYRELLGLSSKEIERLETDGII